MGMTIYYHAYPNECDNKVIRHFIDKFDNELNGKRLDVSFFEACRRYGDYDDENACYIFKESKKLYEFLGLSCIPVALSEYVSEYEYTDCNCAVPRKEDDIFIIWIR